VPIDSLLLLSIALFISSVCQESLAVKCRDLNRSSANIDTSPSISQAAINTVNPVLVGPEWGRIETIIVGNPKGARFPEEVSHMLRATLPSGPTLDEILKNPGKPFNRQLVLQANSEIDGFIQKLQEIGINVLQPMINEDFFSKPITTTHFKTRAGLYAAMPRDNLLFLPPNIVVLAPMAWRSRQQRRPPSFRYY
jgi:hypothetical protein